MTDGKDDGKAARLAAALRENLLRRKARGRAVADAPPADGGRATPPATDDECDGCS